MNEKYFLVATHPALSTTNFEKITTNKPKGPFVVSGLNSLYSCIYLRLLRLCQTEVMAPSPKRMVKSAAAGVKGTRKGVGAAAVVGAAATVGATQPFA